MARRGNFFWSEKPESVTNLLSVLWQLQVGRGVGTESGGGGREGGVPKSVTWHPIERLNK